MKDFRSSRTLNNNKCELFFKEGKNNKNEPLLHSVPGCSASVKSMKNSIRKGKFVFMALLLAIATSGITINKHYSGNSLHDVALFGKADSCCGSTCDCCHDETLSFKVESDFISPPPVTIQPATCFNVEPGILSISVDPFHKDPGKTGRLVDALPGTIKNIQLVFQSFRL